MLLRRMRANRTILLTTHLMDEADACADRVAVMVKGQIHCMGSPSFLKRNVGAGYTLTLARQTASSKDIASKLVAPNLKEVVDWVKSHVGGDVGGDELDRINSLNTCGGAFSNYAGRSEEDAAVIILPFKVNAASFFSDFDRYLKSKGLSDRIVYGVEMPSLESVFLSITERVLGVESDTFEIKNRFDKFDNIGIEEINWQRFVRQTSAVVRFRLHINFQGRLMSTLGAAMPSSLAFGGTSLVLGAIHTMGTEARCGVIAAMLLSCVFVPGFLASQLIDEREKGLRHLLSVSGCETKAFWFGTWIADILSTQTIPILSLWFVSYLFAINEWIWNPAFYISSLLFMLHQSLLGSMMSFAFKSSQAASLFGPAMLLVTTMLVPSLVVLGLAHLLPNVLTDDLPFYRGGTLLYTVAITSPHMLFWSALISMEAPINTNPRPDYSIAIYIQIVECFLMIVWILFFDSSLTSRVQPQDRQYHDEDENKVELEDEDVMIEQDRALQSHDDMDGEPSSDYLKLINIRKEFSSSASGDSFVAVKRVSLVVKKGECVGLLGPNGAGAIYLSLSVLIDIIVIIPVCCVKKCSYLDMFYSHKPILGKTTTIGMISRAILPTEGDVAICGESVLKHAPQALRNLGIVPQDMNTLFDFASVDAHLRLFLNLRPCHSNTTPESEEMSVVNMLESMDLLDQRYKHANLLSGGMKRRLSTAVGLIGSPKVVVLDEPTAGLDPLSRRHVWRALIQAMANDQLALLLTTHSLEEAEVLCNRLAIMVNGALKRLGTPIHLKTRFGRGYEVTLLLGEEEVKEEDKNKSYPSLASSLAAAATTTITGNTRVNAAITTITKQFSSCVVLEQTDNRCRLLISKSDMDLPKVFTLLDGICGAVCKNNDRVSVPFSSTTPTSFYCVNLSSIEQVFLDVVNEH
jgi:ABC-type multidrug transport system ATPase subunit